MRGRSRRVRSGWDIPRKPGSQAPTKSMQQFTLSWPEFDFTVFLYILSNEGILPITHSMQEIFPFHRKNYLGTASNKLSKEKISCHKKESLIKGRHFSSQEEISCHRKQFLVTGSIYLSEVELSCHRKKFLSIRRNFLSQKETACHRKEFYATVRNFLS